jgi:nitrogen fixation protein FixH
MQTLEKLLKFIGILIILMLFFAVKIFIGLAILSLAIVPLTGLYCLIAGRSYNSVIDSNEVVYMLNKMGQYSYLGLAGLIIFYLFFKF